MSSDSELIFRVYFPCGLSIWHPVSTVIQSEALKFTLGTAMHVCPQNLYQKCFTANRVTLDEAVLYAPFNFQYCLVFQLTQPIYF